MTATKTMFRVVALPFALLLTAACGDSPTETSANGKIDPGAAGTSQTSDPWGRAFLSTGVTENGNPRPLVEGTRIRLDFRDDRSSFGASAGCNSMGGSATIEDGHLVVSDLATTEMGCDEPRHAQDQWLGDFLTGRPTFTLTGAEMVLTKDGTEIRLADREVADPDRPLRGTKWVVDGIVSGDAVSSVPQGVEAFVVFSEKEEDGFGGNTGCNSMGGKAVVAETTITFSEVITTQIACEDERGELEKAVMEVLDGEVDYEIQADLLRLSHPSGKGLHLRAAETG